MRSFLSLACLLSLSMTCLGACGGDSASEPTVDFANRYLWNVGGCLAGTVTPFDAVTGEARACSENTYSSNCDDYLMTFTIRGTDLNVSVVVGSSSSSASARLERSLDCSNERALDSETCRGMSAALADDPELFVMRALNVPTERQIDANSLWALKDAPWPGREACLAEVSRWTGQPGLLLPRWASTVCDPPVLGFAERRVPNSAADDDHLRRSSSSSRCC